MHSLLIRFLLVSGLIILLSTPAIGCVGRILYVGAQNSTEDKVMAELLVLLINERTGTNVQIRYFDTQDQIYTALKSDDEETRVDIIVEDTDDAALMTVNGRAASFLTSKNASPSNNTVRLLIPKLEGYLSLLPEFKIIFVPSSR